ncbi:MAG: glycosyltransferase, partial [Alphaproteobacteria bacterium]|nr:glycosyltransferase [Alphaproteobacteria bacterium]
MSRTIERLSLAVPTGSRLPVAVIVPALNAAARLGATLDAVAGSVDAVIVADGGSADATASVAERHGVRVVTAPRGRGPQLRAGAELARDQAWLLFLHADTVLQPGWEDAVRAHIADAAGKAGY